MKRLRPVPSGPLPAERSDIDCLAACAIGEQGALALLFDRHEPHLRRFIDGLAGADAGDVDDLVQTTFLEVWRSAKRFRQESAVRTWLFAIAANVVRTHARSAARRRLFTLSFARQPAKVEVALEDVLSQRFEQRRIATAIALLPHDLRTVFVLCDVEGCAGVDVAAALGIPAGTVGRRLFEGRKRLRAALSANSAKATP